MRRAASMRAARAVPAIQPPAKPVHRIAPELLTRTVRVLVVGCGGTGSEIASGLPYLHHAMLAHGHPGGLDVLLLDGDVVSPTNVVRQPFGLADVGHPKAVLLAHRLNAFWNLRWKGAAAYLDNADERLIGADILIGCVDTRRARAIIQRRVALEGRRNGRLRYWLDLGNDAASGQFILGQPPREKSAAPAPDRLPTVAELYPEVVDAAADAKDDRPSCSAVEALTRQEPFVNRALAGQALAMLARLFRYGELAHHGGFLDLKSGSMTPIPVSPETWARILAVGAQRQERAA